MTIREYFWDGTRVVFGMESGDSDNYRNVKDYPCVDTHYPVDLPLSRYGYYTENGAWKHQRLEAFPAEFRAHLLLLGIA